jgi:hypothetical protein
MDTRTYQELEHQFACHPEFGDWENITSNVLSFYTSGLDILSKDIPSAHELLEHLKQADNEIIFHYLGDPSVRAILNQCLTAKKNGKSFESDKGQLFKEITFRVTKNGNVVSPTESDAKNALRLAYGLAGCWIWTTLRETPDPLGDVFKALFEQEIATSVSSDRAILRNPTEEISRVLQEGYSLLNELVPELAASMLAHVHLIAILDVADESQWHLSARYDLCQNVSTHAIPGTIFLSPTPLANPWLAAEAILHESMHKKLSDLTLTQNIFRTGFSAAESPTIRALWNHDLSWNSNAWSIDRALFALHFYTQIVVFFLAVDAKQNMLSSKYGACHWDNPKSNAASALKRAIYLWHELQPYAEAYLGNDGRLLLGWLGTMLKRMAPDMFGQDYSVEHLLERYDRESIIISRLLSKIPDDSTPDSPLGQIIDHLIHSEIVSAFRIFSILGQVNEPQFIFYDAENWTNEMRSSLQFHVRKDILFGIRTFTSATLRNCNQGQLSKTGVTRRKKQLKEFVIDLVDHAGRHIDKIYDLVIK